MCIRDRVFPKVSSKSNRRTTRTIHTTTRISGQCSDGVGGSRHPAPVLLFEYKQYSACSTSHVLIGPGDTFQHCASARDSGARMGDLECVDGLSSPNSMMSWKSSGPILCLGRDRLRAKCMDSNETLQKLGALPLGEGGGCEALSSLSLIHISEPTRPY